jgi:LysM repeat protein
MLTRRSVVHGFVGSAFIVVAAQSDAENCEPIRACDATRDCTPVDKRDCEPHWGCDYKPWEFLAKAACETNKGQYKATCELAKDAQNKLYLAQRPLCEAQKSAEKLDCERIKSLERLACEAGLAGPWRCTAQEVMLEVRTTKQKSLTDFEEQAAFISTPLKTATGQLAWRDTACIGYGVGVPYVNSQRSNDGFCTLDVKLLSFSIEGEQKPPGDRYIRLEILPGGRGAALCASQTISKLNTVKFSGPIKRDKHFPGQRWLEVHVTDDFELVPSASATTMQTPAREASPPIQYVVRRGDSLVRIAQSQYASKEWYPLYRVNSAKIKNPDLIYPDQVLVFPSEGSK